MIYLYWVLGYGTVAMDPFRIWNECGCHKMLEKVHLYPDGTIFLVWLLFLQFNDSLNAVAGKYYSGQEKYKQNIGGFDLEMHSLLQIRCNLFVLAQLLTITQY